MRIKKTLSSAVASYTISISSHLKYMDDGALYFLIHMAAINRLEVFLMLPWSHFSLILLCVGLLITSPSPEFPSNF